MVFKHYLEVIFKKTIFLEAVLGLQQNSKEVTEILSISSLPSEQVQSQLLSTSPTRVGHLLKLINLH